MLDFIHRLYESEESIHILSELIFSKLFISLTIVQIMLGTIGPLLMLAGARYSTLPDELRRLIYVVAALLIQVGIFSTRWNVVIGGQLFSDAMGEASTPEGTYIGMVRRNLETIVDGLGQKPPRE